MNWDDLKIFLAVAEAPSMRAAAKAIRVSHSTVSRRIDSLESSLNTRLFDRLPEGYSLTNAGHELVPVAQKMRGNIDTYQLKLLGRDADLQGHITITMPDSVAVSFLMPIIAEFQAKYPQIIVKIDDSTAIFDLTRREADIALRFTNTPPEHLIGRKIGAMYQATYASASYIEDHKPEDVNTTARWVAWGQPETNPAWIARSPYPHLPIAGHYDNPLIQREAIRNNVGLGYLPCAIMEGDPCFVRLSEPEPQMDFWVLSHPDLKATARLKVFREFLFKRADKIAAILRGDHQQQDGQ